MAILILEISFLYRTTSFDLAILARSNTRGSKGSAVRSRPQSSVFDLFVSRVTLSREEMVPFGSKNSNIIQSLFFSITFFTGTINCTTLMY
jgi:hypothetical protein